MRVKPFVLQIGAADENGRFPLNVISSPAGQTRRAVWQSFPDDAPFQDQLAYLSELSGTTDEAKAVGRRLAAFLFPQPVHERFKESLGMARQTGKPLRIRLQIDAPKLRAVPWEYLYDDELNLFLAQNRDTLLVRTIAEPFAVADTAVPQPVRVLLVVCSPSDLGAIDAPAQITGVQQALAGLADQPYSLRPVSDHALRPVSDRAASSADQTALTLLENASRAQLTSALREHRPHVLHFIGHGRRDGLALVDEATGTAQFLDAEQIIPLLRGSGVKAVLLSACNTAQGQAENQTDAWHLNIAEAVVRAGVPALLAAQYALPVETALRFNRALYRALAQGYGVDTAVTEARIATFAAGDDKLHWAVPLLYLQPEDGTIWQKPKPPQPDVPEALRPYLEMVVRRNGRLPLGPLDPAGKEGSHISLPQIFVNLNADLAYRILTEGQPEAYEAHEFYKAALAHLHHHRQLVLLGDPGSGKSTILRFVAHCLAGYLFHDRSAWLEKLTWMVGVRKYASAEREIVYGRNASLTADFKAHQIHQRQWQGDVPVPIVIELRDFARTKFKSFSPNALWHYVRNQLEKEDLAEVVPPLEKIAKAGGLIFLLDGVDEVPFAQRTEIWQVINALERGPYGGNRWVVTCRSLSFDAHEAPVGVPSQTLRALDDGQVGQFIESWYAALVAGGELSQEKADAMTTRLQQAVERPSLQPLAQNPMLLTIMAIVQTYYGTLPDERARLYQACVETLLLRWQRQKEEGGGELPSVLEQLGIGQADLERLLWQIGWQAHSQAVEREDAADIPEWDVLQIARERLGSLGKAEQFLEYTERRAHLLVGRGGVSQRVYTFPHRTFQEYLAACHLASGRRFGREAAKLAAQGDMWREVLNLAAGTLVFNQNNREKALDGIEQVLPRRTPQPDDTAGWYRVWMAAEMMLVVGREQAEKDEVGRELLPRLRDQLVALLAAAALTPVQRAEAGDVLGRLGDPRPGVCTLEPDMIPIPAGPFLMGEDKQEVHVDAFAIARYPVTNAQYRYFIEDGGYTEKWRHCWTEEGWAEREKEDWTEPRYWQDADWSIGNKPVVGVSWYEARAYANWLEEKTGKTYRLPVADQWERAARHTDGREYPWGNKQQNGIINSREAGVGRPTAVGAFPQGKAECGAYDMSGNVFERTLKEIVCGGAFSYNLLNSCVAYRIYYNPHNWFNDVGFRVAEHLSDPAS